jgi:TIR domain
MKSIFISYRRESTAGEARALATDLGKKHRIRTFVDVDNIALGHDFREILKQQLSMCDQMLVLIGRDWAICKNEFGQSRLEDPEDYVRTEISAALNREIPVTPILVQGARMPAAKDLPQDIRGLASRQGFELSHSRWESDFSELVRRLELDPGRRVIPNIKTAPRRWVVMGFLFVVGIGVFVIAYPSIYRMLFPRFPALFEIAGTWHGTSNATPATLQLQVSRASHARDACNQISGKMTDDHTMIDNIIEGEYCAPYGSVKFKRSNKQNDTIVDCQNYEGSLIYFLSGLQMTGNFKVVTECGGQTGPD